MTNGDNGWKKLVSIMENTAEAFKIGTTRYSVGFMASNFFKDTWGAAVNSENPLAIPIVDNIKGIISQFSKNPEIQKYVDEFKENGGLYAGITEIKKNTQKGINNAIRRAFEEGNTTQKTGDLIMRGLETWGAMNEISELAPKITEYIYLRTKKNMPIKEAVMRAREVNINFQRIGGPGMQRANRITPFMNANIQGVDKFARTFMARPGMTSAKVAVLVGLPTLAAWAMGNLGDEKDREEYNGILRSQKDTAWYFKMGDSRLSIS